MRLARVAGIVLLGWLLASGGLAGALADGELDLDASEFEPVRDRVMELDLHGAWKAYAAAKKELKGRLREKEVKRALALSKRQIEALEEYEEARKQLEKGMVAQAHRTLEKMYRKRGAVWFERPAEELYAELKSRLCYVVNDFETESSRQPDNFGVNETQAAVEVVEDVRLSREGLHSLRIRLHARRQGVRRGDPGTYRAVAIRTPSDFPDRLDTRKAMTFWVYSPRRVPDLIGVDIIGDTEDGTALSSAVHEGISLNFTGWKEFRLPLRLFRFHGKFEWSQAKALQLSTTGPSAVEFYIDDIRLSP